MFKTMQKVATVALAIAPVAAGVLLMSSLEASAYDRSIRVVNNSSDRLVSLYATHVDRSGWGPDLLAGTIPPGRQRIIDVEDYSGYCRYDFKAVFSSGATAEKWRMNACVVESWRITD